MKTKKCIVCNKSLTPRSRPTVYKIYEYPRLGAPEYLYLCAQCSKKNEPSLKNLLENYANAVKNDEISSKTY